MIVAHKILLRNQEWKTLKFSTKQNNYYLKEIFTNMAKDKKGFNV